MNLVGKNAPTFKATAVQKDRFIEDFSLANCAGKYVIFFFYPLDFTFVCPTELHAFQARRADFEEREAVVVGCSVDSKFAHYTWLNTPKNQGGIEGVGYPIVSDVKKEIAEMYGVLKADEGIAYRGLFLIDKEGVVRHQPINDLPLGSSVDEALRTPDPHIFHETHGEVCPANWQGGEKAMAPTKEGVSAYLSDVK